MSNNGVHRNQEAERENLGFLSVFFSNVGWALTVIWAVIALLIWTLFVAAVGLFENTTGYKRKPTINKEKFWNQVYACLLEFHGFTPERAEKEVIEKRKQVASKIHGPDGPQLTYFKQPFDVANDIAGFQVSISLEDWRERYVKKILGKQ